MLHVLELQDLVNARYYSRGRPPLRAPKFRGGYLGDAACSRIIGPSER
jgi:hypothetical protein